jgi:hypothetical protein
MIFTMELQEINGVGRYGVVHRQLIRFCRLSKRYCCFWLIDCYVVRSYRCFCLDGRIYRRLQRRYGAVALYMRINKPILKCLAPIFMRICGWDLLPEAIEVRIQKLLRI